MMRLTLAALGAAMALVCSQSAFAAAWSLPELRDGMSTWTEASTTDSGVLHIGGRGAWCDNTGSTSVTIYRALSDGTKKHAFETLVAGTSCRAADANDSCGTVYVPPGYIVADPDSTAGSLACHGAN